MPKEILDQIPNQAMKNCPRPRALVRLFDMLQDFGKPKPCEFIIRLQNSAICPTRSEFYTAICHFGGRSLAKDFEAREAEVERLELVLPTIDFAKYKAEIYDAGRFSEQGNLADFTPRQVTTKPGENL